jgi:hypothetical protein
MMSKKPWDGIEQPPDEGRAGSPWFYVSTYKEFQEGLKIILKELEKHSSLITDLGLASSPYEKEKKRLTTMIEWGEEHLKGKNFDHDDIYINGVSYGSLRYLKAAMLLRVKQLSEKRDSVLKEHAFVPRAIIQSINERIEQLTNLAEQGVLNGLRPADIFFEVIGSEGKVPPKEEYTLASPMTGDKGMNTDIAVVDPILRDRCLGLFEAVMEGGGEDRLDSVIREMSVILEDRVRDLTGYTGKLTGVDLFGVLMAKEPYRIKFSDQKDVQESAHLLFRGYSGFVRNEVMHKLVRSYTKERVLQLLGMVDYLLFILSRAVINKFDG